jgi:predicted small secreted protein
MKKLILGVVTLMFTVGLTACNTMHGVGKDVERGGEKMQNAADRNK